MAIIYAFVKLFEKKEYAEDFIAGKLYMNTIRYFKEYTDESGELRGDPYEGISALYQPDQLSEIQLGGISIPASDLALPIVVHSDHLLSHNVFCIYALNSRGFNYITAETLADFKRTIELHKACFGLGKYCVIIKNAQEFKNRCIQAIKSSNVTGTLGAVDYFDEHSFHGNMPEDKLGYQKRCLFQHQREYRIKIDLNRDVAEPYTLEVGDLSDIAIQMTPEEFNANLELKLPDGSSV